MSALAGGADMLGRSASAAADPARLRRARLALLVVCVLHGLSPLITNGLHQWFGWDETVYISQINRFVPAGVFSAPRARGLTVLVAPVGLVTQSVAAMRLWLAVLSAVGLYVCLRPWQRLRPGYVAPVAGLLWSSIWISIFYSDQAMPNQYLAYGTVAAAGFTLLAIRGPRLRGPLICAAAALAVAALMRPSDTLFALLPLAAVALLIPGLARRQRLTIVAALIGGFLVGWAEWGIEAVVRFGGPAARFHAAAKENSGGLHMALGAQARTLAGPLLCRGGCHASAPVGDRLWWFALVPLTVLGLYAARRRHVGWMYGAAVAVGLAVLVQYAVAVDYSAPRFLLPTYLFLALAVAEALSWVVASVGATWRPVALGVLLVVFLVHAGNQVLVLRHDVLPPVRADGARHLAIGRWLHNHGLTGRCLVIGADNGPNSFAAHCTDTPQSAKGVRRDLAGGTAVAVVTHGPPPTSGFFSTWTSIPIRARHVTPGWRAWIKIPPSHTAPAGSTG